MRFLKSISKWVWLIAALLIVFFVLRRTKVIPSFSSIFTSQRVSIDETPILVKEIRAIAELNTASLYHEFVIDSTQPSILPLNSLKKRIVLIAKGRVTAGVNLQALDSNRIFVDGDSVNMQLPKAQVTGVELNPSSFETFYENGRWSSSEIAALKARARNILLKEADRRNLMQKADEKARESMKNFLRAAGFKRIEVRSI